MRTGFMARLLAMERLAHPEAHWEKTTGLWALLEAARHLPRDERPVDEDDRSPLAQLLREARARIKEDPR